MSTRHVQPPSKRAAASGGGQSAAAAAPPTTRAFDRQPTFDDRTTSSPSMSTAHPDERPAQASSPQQLRGGLPAVSGGSRQEICCCGWNGLLPQSPHQLKHDTWGPVPDQQATSFSLRTHRGRSSLSAGGSSNGHSMSTRNAGRAAQVEASQRVRKESSEGHSMSTRKRPGELAARTSPCRQTCG